MSSLTPKQQAFVQEYLIDLNATQAAIRAGYSEKTANRIGSENLSKPDIAEAIEKAMNERAEKTKTSAEWVIKELAKNHDRAVDLEQLAVANKSLELIGKHHGAFNEDKSGAGGGSVTIVLNESGKGDQAD